MRSQIIAIITVILITAVAHAQPHIMTYQGNLSDEGVPANGDYHFLLHILDFSDTTLESVFYPATVTNGLFTANPSFDSATFIDAVKLRIEVRPANEFSGYTTLSPDLDISAAPVAMYALTGNEGPDSPQGIPGPQGFVGPHGEQGIQGDQGLQGIQGDQGLQGGQGDPGTDGIDGLDGSPGDSHWLISGAATYTLTSAMLVSAQAHQAFL